MKDFYGRNINYLRISVTDLCNLRCKYCMPEVGVTKKDHKNILTFEEIEIIAKQFVSLGVNKIRLTGGEPLTRPGLIDLVRKIGNMEAVTDFAITTNGVLLKKYAKDLKMAGLTRVNISIDTLDEDKFSKMTRIGHIQDIFEGIEEAKKVGFHKIKLNVVLIGGFNDDEIVDLVNLTKEDDIDVRFIELMPIGEVSDWSLKRFVPVTEVLDRVKELVPTFKDDISSPATYYQLPKAKGKVGLIRPMTCKFCNYCNRVRLTSDGKLKLCLHTNDEIDLKGPLRKGEDIKKLIETSILNKPPSHQLEDGIYIKRNMVQIGG